MTKKEKTAFFIVDYLECGHIYMAHPRPLGTVLTKRGLETKHENAVFFFQRFIH